MEWLLSKKVQISKIVTFEHFAKRLLDSISKTGKKASQIHVVFDVYNSGSIKTAERIRRISGKLLFCTIVVS